jgi:hypothetical protein
VKTLEDITNMLASHMGSKEAAELWLNTVDPVVSNETPKETIDRGRIDIIIAYLEDHWGPGPSYS